MTGGINKKSQILEKNPIEKSSKPNETRKDTKSRKDSKITMRTFTNTVYRPKFFLVLYL